ncbi:RHO protein GDP dissociation inhibitor [Trichostrongylus colubriformis]|uniref:RHO protein GDP dissociation inhibitor n=1 Tax=Trichostrongylus colubriformis TaxID=6319 RepID=A0AAN8G392_TRICO
MGMIKIRYCSSLKRPLYTVLTVRHWVILLSENMYFSFEHYTYLPNNEYVIGHVEHMSAPLRNEMDSASERIGKYATKARDLMTKYENRHNKMMELRADNEYLDDKLLKDHGLQKNSLPADEPMEKVESAWVSFKTLAGDTISLLETAKRDIMAEDENDKRIIMKEVKQNLDKVQKMLSDMEELYEREYDRLHLQTTRKDQLRKLVRNDPQRGPLHIAHEHVRATLFIDALCLITDGLPEYKLKFLRGVPPPDTTLLVKEGRLYKFRIDFYVHRSPVHGLKYRHTVHRLGERILEEWYYLGDFEPGRSVQTFALPLERAPEGSFHLGVYTLKGIMVDKYHRELAAWRWFCKIIRSYVE